MKKIKHKKKFVKEYRKILKFYNANIIQSTDITIPQGIIKSLKGTLFDRIELNKKISLFDINDAIDKQIKEDGYDKVCSRLWSCTDDLKLELEKLFSKSKSIYEFLMIKSHTLMLLNLVMKIVMGNDCCTNSYFELPRYVNL